MSVPSSKRTISDMEFYTNAIKLQDQIEDVLLRNFGMKDRISDLKLPGNGRQLSPKDRQKILAILEPYNAGADILLQYPQWLLSYKRECILNIMGLIISSIVQANSIYPQCHEEAIERRQLQTNAIAYCYQLHQHLNAISRRLPSDANNLRPFCEMIQREVDLLKGWRKTDPFIKKYGKSSSECGKAA